MAISLSVDGKGVLVAHCDKCNETQEIGTADKAAEPMLVVKESKTASGIIAEMTWPPGLAPTRRPRVIPASGGATVESVKVGPIIKDGLLMFETGDQICTDILQEAMERINDQRASLGIDTLSSPVHIQISTGLFDPSKLK